MAFPVVHVRRKVEGALRKAGHWFEARDGETVVVYAAEGELPGIIRVAGEVLGEVERRDTTAVVTPGGHDLGVLDLANVRTLSRLMAQDQGAWLTEVLRHGRLTAHFQPIVATADGEVVGHEALARGVAVDGSLIPPARLFDAARDAGLLFQLDLATRRTAVQRAREVGLEGKLLINFSPTSVYDPATCLRSTVAAVDSAGIARDRIIFELVETEQVHDTAHLTRILRYYRDAGFAVALDDVGSGYSSLNILHQLRPDYLKLDMELVRDVHHDPFKAVIAAKVLEIAQQLDIATIAEGIECEGELAWVRAHGATYAQGYHLGRPSPEPRSAPRPPTAPPPPPATPSAGSRPSTT